MSTSTWPFLSTVCEFARSNFRDFGTIAKSMNITMSRIFVGLQYAFCNVVFRVSRDIQEARNIKSSTKCHSTEDFG